MRTFGHLRAPRSRIVLMVSTAVLFSATAAVAHAQGTPVKGLTPELQAARAGLEKYKDPIAAVRDGYFSTVACIDFPQGATDGTIVYPPGAMGVHLLNTANIGPNLDPAKPQILLYEQVGDKLVLTGAEWFMPVAVAGGTAPQIFGQTLKGPMDGHAPIMPPTLRHYDLHVWLWKNNPRGIFTSTNSAVKCARTASYTVRVPGDMKGMKGMK
jgi:hypothetical protein